MQKRINETLIDEADFINITMPMYNLIEYSDNYSDTSGSLWQFKRDEIVNNADVTNNEYKASIIGDTENNGTKNGVKIAVPLKYLSNFWKSLEMPLINCKVELSLKWIENCMLTAAADANKVSFKITDAKFYAPIVTLSIEDNAKLFKLLSEGFKRPIYWNEYKVIPNKIVEIVAINEEKYIITYDDKVLINFLPRVKIENHNIEIDRRNFYDFYDFYDFTTN